MGLDGFEFVEFTAMEPGILEPVFELMGFSLVAKHRSKAVELWRQGDINLITNYEPNNQKKWKQHTLVVNVGCQ
jgi:4-hydroxyphenylpyruvate dioxygenase